MVKAIKYGFILLLTFLCSAMVARGQETERMRLELSMPAGSKPGSARVLVKEMGDAEAVIRALDGVKKPESTNGYRVRIFFDNSQSARAMANEIEAQFRESFPGIAVYKNYENPYFKVTVGNCLTNEEAITLWGNVKQRFDKAFVIRERIQFGAIKNEPIDIEEQEATNPRAD